MVIYPLKMVDLSIVMSQITHMYHSGQPQRGHMYHSKNRAALWRVDVRRILHHAPLLGCNLRR